MERPDKPLRHARPGSWGKFFDRKTNLITGHALRCGRLSDRSARGEFPRSRRHGAMYVFMLVVNVLDRAVVMVMVLGEQEKRVWVRHFRSTMTG
jgi:hypothetical protein